MTDPLIPAEPPDLPAIEAFLAAHSDSSMFLRANLAAHGLDDSRARLGMQVVLSRDGGQITGVFGVTNTGFALVQAPRASGADWAGFARWLAPRPFAGITGEAGQIAAALAALALPPGDFAALTDEPLYRLDLSRLRVATLAPGTLRRPRERDRALLTRWFTDYEMTTLGTPRHRATEMGEDRADMAIDGDRLRLLDQDGTVVAMGGFNARLPGIVQVGSVYTPPEYRNRHAARTVVARHLQEVEREGVAQAVLFASGPAACRCYEALGFEQVGRYALALLREPRAGADG